jgi:RNA polymerase sigma-70 factor, ECF subfamily
LIPQVQELVARARQQDADAFAALIGQYERAALSVAYAQLRDSDRAGDAVQEAFLRAWQELPRLNDPARFGGWLMQIVRNAAIDLQRRARPTTSVFPDLAARESDPAATAAWSDTADRINAALAALDDSTRAVVTMRYYDGMSSKQIAELLDMSPAAVDMRLSRARQDLRSQLADVMQEETAKDSLPFPRLQRKVQGE